jgi:hypothetical protein
MRQGYRPPSTTRREVGGVPNKLVFSVCFLVWFLDAVRRGVLNTRSALAMDFNPFDG